MNPVLQTLRHQIGEAIDAFIAEHSFPIVEPDKVTFIYRGAADQVLLQHWIFSVPSSQPLQRLEGTDLWYLEMNIPENSRVEYKFDIVRGDHHDWINDPLNPITASDPFGANSVCQSYGYQTPEWIQPDPAAATGHLETLTLDSEAFGEPRSVQLYIPAYFRPTRRYPLLIVHDGDDFVKFARLQTILDNLIHHLEIPPLIAALTQSPDRLREYPDDTRHAAFLTEELVPELQQNWPLIAEPAGRCLMGASFGAVASLSTAWRYPGFYGNLLLQSGSFAFTDIGDHKRSREFDPVVEFVNAFRHDPRQAADRLYVSCGIYESLIYENRSMVPFLQHHGFEVRYEEARDGHNWENWRDRLRSGLTWLFPGPLWMVYE